MVGGGAVGGEGKPVTFSNAVCSQPRFSLECLHIYKEIDHASNRICQQGA